jgi:hypothetical protein
MSENEPNWEAWQTVDSNAVYPLDRYRMVIGDWERKYEIARRPDDVWILHCTGEGIHGREFECPTLVAAMGKAEELEAQGGEWWPRRQR